MGLDLECDGEMIKMGSYSSVHRQRTGLVAVSIARIKATGDHRGGALLQSTLSKSSGNEIMIDYTTLRKIRPYFFDTEDGLFLFVDHSDCDGSWSPSEAESIVAWFESLRPWMHREKSLGPYINPTTGQYHIENIFQRSIESGAPVICM